MKEQVKELLQVAKGMKILLLFTLHVALSGVVVILNPTNLHIAVLVLSSILYIKFWGESPMLSEGIKFIWVNFIARSLGFCAWIVIAFLFQASILVWVIVGLLTLIGTLASAYYFIILWALARSS